MNARIQSSRIGVTSVASVNARAPYSECHVVVHYYARPAIGLLLITAIRLLPIYAPSTLYAIRVHLYCYIDAATILFTIIYV